MKLTTYYMINDTHHFVVFNSNHVSITKLDEMLNPTTKYTNDEFADYVNKNNIQFYDWESEISE